MQMLQGRVCRAGCPGGCKEVCAKVLGRPRGVEKRDNPDLAPGEGSGILLGGEQGAPGPEWFSDVPNFTALYCWTDAEIWLSPLPGPLL